MTRRTTAMMMILLCLGGCADVFPMIDSAGTQVMQTGGCLKFKCDLPLENCRVRPGVCK